MSRPKSGWGTRYDKFSGEWMARQRNLGEATGVFIKFNSRFCETCKQRKPSDKTKAFKGWKCADCKTKEKKVA